MSLKTHVPSVDKARGALIGALVGDAAGATLEFLGRSPTDAEVDQALRMSGGGAFRVAPGQYTDDGELTVALARSLIGAHEYPADKVAGSYRNWFQSSPFDYGQATRNALGGDGPRAGADVASAVLKRAIEHNLDSKANGALMRATPLGIWATRLGPTEAVAAGRTDAALTHPNSSCQWATAVYVVAIRHLLLTDGDGHGAMKQAVEVATEGANDGAMEVLDWLGDAAAGRLPQFHPQAGFVRIGFTHAFHHLNTGTPYEEALCQVLAGGGDTDTNACSVCGLIVARDELSAIPEQMWQAVIHRVTQKGRPSPRWVQAADALELV